MLAHSQRYTSRKTAPRCLAALSPVGCARCAVVAPSLQAGDVRTSIGSGLLQLGIQSKASVGIYGINCKGAATSSRQGGGPAGVQEGHLIPLPVHSTLVLPVWFRLFASLLLYMVA